MAFSGVTSQQYEDFLSDGGELTLTLDRSDFSRNGEFEHFPDLQDRLDTGFELPPPSLVEEPAARAHILVHGDQWSRTMVVVYSRGGRIVYRRLLGGRYEAKLSLPPRA